MKKFSILSILVLLLLSACRDPFLDEPFIEYTGEDLELSNAEFLKKYEDKYSLWIQLLKHADMFNALNDASSVSTVFAPDNQAVENFLEWRGVESVEELDFEYARYVAQVHILAQNLPEAVFISYVEDGSIPIKTVFGTYLSTSYGFMDNEVDDIFLPQVMVQDSLSIYLNNQAKVTALARTTANGQVYTLGAVIRPLAESILDILAPYREYDIFIEAARLTEYDKIVSVYADTVYNLDGSFSVNNIRFTCFAVPDSVYNQAGISSAEELAAHLGAGQNYTDTLNALYQYMSYHFLGQIYSKAALFNFKREGQLLIFDTKLPGQVIISEHVEGESKINKVAKIIRSGIQARNGVIHK
ncbi:MAG: fasciclin domain-containing protein, partial [Bacteroidales bacterium]|nr:fasciclin domain-containing protein [Bacteroidales bacterium]